MKLYLIFSILLCASNQIVLAQSSHNGYEQRITTINYYGSWNDTLINVNVYDSNGDHIPVKSKMATISYPVRVDTHFITANIIEYEYTFEDSIKSFTREITVPNNFIKVITYGNQSDTIYKSVYWLDKNGIPQTGKIESWMDTTNILNSANLSMEELQLILKNINKYSGFLKTDGLMEFESRKKLKITNRLNIKEITKISLNRKSKPKKIIVKQWHSDHMYLFVNSYTFKYRNNRLVKITNRDEYGDVEMIRTFEYIENLN